MRLPYNNQSLLDLTKKGGHLFIPDILFRSQSLPQILLFMPTFGNQTYLYLTLFSPDILHPSQSLPRI